MTEFDQKLNVKLHYYKADTGKALHEIADEIGIPRSTFYKFSSGNNRMNGEHTKQLMDYLNLTVELKPKTQ